MLRWNMAGAGLLLAAWGWCAPASAQLLAAPKLEVGCDWMLAFDPAQPELGNTALPETNARYWIAVVSDTAPAGSRLRVEGRYPEARYSGLHVHDGNLFIHDALSDNELQPDAGAFNRNVDRTVRDGLIAPGGRYTAYVRINTAPPAARERNTLYRKPPALLDGKVKKRTALAYRTYLAEGENTGGVGLPKLVLETPQGERALPHAADAATCESIRQQLYNPGGGGLGLLTPPLVPETTPLFRKFDGALFDALGVGVGYNPHNGFMSAKTDRALAEVLLVRGQLPSYTTQTPAAQVPQVRYWSMCSYGAASTRVYGCVADRQLQPDAEGYFNVAISTDAQRPVALAAGYAWLPWGSERQGTVMIRELLAHPGFGQSIEKSSANKAAADRNGYMPLATYCSRALFNAAMDARLAPAQAFEACRAARGTLPKLF